VSLKWLVEPRVRASSSFYFELSKKNIAVSTFFADYCLDGYCV